MNSLSNWGRWGDDDQRGCLNLVTPSKAKQAAGLVQDGASVSCARPILTEMAADTTFQVQRYMVDSGEGRDTDLPERTLTRRGAAEFIGMVFHGQTITHIDALSHYSCRGSCTTASRPTWLPLARVLKPIPSSRPAMES